MPPRGAVLVWLLALAGLLLAWSSAIVPGLSYLATPILLGLAGWFVSGKRWRPLLLFAGLSPFVYSTLAASISYFDGTAVLRTHGYPPPDAPTVQTTTGYRLASGGCMVNGSEWVLEVPHDLTLAALYLTLGPMPGALPGQ